MCTYICIKLINTKVKQIKRGTMKDKKKMPILPHDWNKQLQVACGVSQVTVTYAIRYNTKGKKAEMVREKYREMFLND